MWFLVALLDLEKAIARSILRHTERLQNSVLWEEKPQAAIAIAHVSKAVDDDDDGL